MAEGTQPARAKLRMSDELVAAVLEVGTVRLVPRRTVVIAEGVENDSFCVVLSGRVRVFMSDERGRELLISFLGPGESFGEVVVDGEVHPASVIAEADTRLACVHRDAYIGLLTSRPDFAMYVVRSLAGRARRLAGALRSMALKDVYGRVIQLLSSEAVEHDGRRVVPRRFTQLAIAKRTGASRSMVSRILSDLHFGGYLAPDSDGLVILRPPPERW